jgi:hypothetical protein
MDHVLNGHRLPTQRVRALQALPPSTIHLRLYVCFQTYVARGLIVSTRLSRPAGIIVGNRNKVVVDVAFVRPVFVDERRITIPLA